MQDRSGTIHRVTSFFLKHVTNSFTYVENGILKKKMACIYRMELNFE